MAPYPLPTGRYFISNKAFDNFAGHWLEGGDATTKLPIIGTRDRFVWVVTHVKDDLYDLTLNEFIAVGEENKVWGYRRFGPGGGAPKLWRIQAVDHLNVYHIIDPDTNPETGGFSRLWTLDRPDTQVTLERPLLPPDDPRKFWRFEPLPFE